MLNLQNIHEDIGKPISALSGKKCMLYRKRQEKLGFEPVNSFISG